jgi:hypothetical protein
MKDLIQTQTSQFDNTITTLGNDFARIVSDWGRLQAVDEPLRSNQFVWDSAAVGTYLKVLDLSAHGRYYPLLMAGNSEFFVTHIQHADDEYVGRTTHECSYQYFYQAQDANYTGPSSGEIQDFSWMLGTAWYPGTIDSQNTNKYRAGHVIHRHTGHHRIDSHHREHYCAAVRKVVTSFRRASKLSVWSLEYRCCRAISFAASSCRPRCEYARARR